MKKNHHHSVHPAPMFHHQTSIHSVRKPSRESSVQENGDSTKIPFIEKTSVEPHEENREGENHTRCFPPRIQKLAKEDEDNDSCDSLLGTPMITPGTTPAHVIAEDIETNYNPLMSAPLTPKEKEISRKQSYMFPESHGISNDLFHHSKHACPLIRKLLLYLILTFFGLFIFLCDDIYVHNYSWIPSTTTYHDGTSQSVPSYRLTFIGDSLIHRPYVEFDLGGRLQRHLPSINVNITDRSVEGNTIARCRKTILDDVRPGSADMVILFWDTDVSDYDESSMTSEEVAKKRADYLEDLTYVINVVKAAGVTYIAISGPNILGEANLFTFLLPPYIIGKKQMLIDYVEMNRNASQSLSVDYIDMRQVFLDHLPSSWFLPLYYLTFDGEHPNARGAGIIALEFANQIAKWTNSPINRRS